MAIALALLQGVEQAPEAIPCFFAALLFLAGAVVLFSGGEGVNLASVILGIAFVTLGGAYIWLALAEWPAL